MEEPEALVRLAELVPDAGDDAAVADGLAVTTDMLHASTDFPPATTRYTAGWRSVAASLSDIAAMGASPVATVAAYGAPSIDWEEVSAFVEGAQDVSAAVGAEYVGGDLDAHEEFSVATTAVGRADDPVYRSGASVGDVVCVTGTLGRSGAALRLFETGETERANDLFRFEPRIEAGRQLAADATAMMDSSDGLARSLHQLSAASDCGVAIQSPLPVDDAVEAVATDEDDRQTMGLFFGEDFELVCTLPDSAVDAARRATSVPLTPIGTVTESSLQFDGEPLPDRGYTHS